MNDPMKDNLIRDLKRRLAEKAGQEPPRSPINIAFGLGAPISGHTSSGGSSPAPFLTPVAGGSGHDPSGSADSWGSTGRPPNDPGSTTSPPGPVFDNPLYSSNRTRSSSNEIVEDDPPLADSANFRTAEVHHREPLTRPLSPARRGWNGKDPIDVEPISVTVLEPDGHYTFYRQNRDAAGAGRLRWLIGTLRRIWPAPALSQVPAWFEQWWNKPARRPARPTEQSTWALLRAGRFDALSLDIQALLQIAAFSLLALLALFLVYMLYDSWMQGRQVVATSASGDGKPGGRTIYIPRGLFRRERARRKERGPLPKQPTGSAPSVATPPTPDYAALYEYPPRWVP